MQLVSRHVIERLSQIRVIFQSARKSLSVAQSPSIRICWLQLAVSSLPFCLGL